MPKFSFRQISGQVGIVVVLITAAILTFGLAVADRVVKESKVTVDRSDSIRVFNLAETGVDEALNKIYQFEAGLISDLDGNLASNSLNQVSIASSQTYEGYINQGESLRVDLKNTAGSIRIKWSEQNCDSSYKVGILLSMLYYNGSEYQNDYYLIASDDCLYHNQQNFLKANLDATTKFKYHYDLPVTALTDASLYIQSIGSGTLLEVSGNIIANAQYKIESLARSKDDISNKAIQVTRSIPTAPTFMTFALFSGGTIVK